MIEIGKTIPKLQGKMTSNLSISLPTSDGSSSIIFFYPKDNTPGCTTEAGDFRDHYEQFKALNINVYGLSRDSLKSHENFKAKLQLPFELISDEDEAICQAFDVIKMKNMYGKQVRGIERSTFIINQKGILTHEFRGVKVAGHVAALLALVQSA